MDKLIEDLSNEELKFKGIVNATLLIRGLLFQTGNWDVKCGR